MIDKSIETKQSMSKNQSKEKDEDCEKILQALQQEIIQLRSEIENLKEITNTMSEEIKREREILDVQIDKLLFIISLLEKQHSDFLNLIGELNNKISALELNFKVWDKEEIKNEKN